MEIPLRRRVMDSKLCYQMCYPEGMNALVSHVQRSKPYSILPHSEFDPGRPNSKSYAVTLHYHCTRKMTGIDLESISYVDMHFMIEKGPREGMSVISHRKAEANNKYMNPYGPENPSKYIT